jgi:aspartate-semialdehyde dehydrogenase
MKHKVGILGATGMVGQRFMKLLENHPYFEVTTLLASSRSAGKKYSEVAKWYLKEEIPKGVSDMVVEDINPAAVDKYDLDIVFSAIPSEIAREVEGAFAKKIPVFSNTATYRMDEDVPLIVPEVNPEHLDLIAEQKKKRGWEGFVVTNPNCTTIGFVIPLKPIMDKYGIEYVHMTSMQALSGAGYDGVPSMAILDNVIPFIRNEEEKAEIEPLKILGRMDAGKVKYADFEVLCACNRVNVRDGHTKSLFVKTKKDCSLEELSKALSGFEGEPQKMNLPTAPKPVIIISDKEDRPQPFFDRDNGGGMAITVGRMRKKKENLFRFTCISHNTIRGAAGASVLNAELAYKKKIF